MSATHDQPAPFPRRRTRSVSLVLGLCLAVAGTALSGTAAWAQKGPSTNDAGEREAVEFDQSALRFDAGLQATVDTLTAQDGLEPDESFVLAAAHFLRGIEIAFQSRYRHGVTNSITAIAVMRLGLPPNPQPEPFTGAVIETLFLDLETHMDAARDVLATIDDDASFSVPLDLASLWLDVNADGTAQPGENLLQLTGAVFGGRQARGALEQMAGQLIVDFDQSDAAWLNAYTHLISGTGDLVLALQPADIIDAVFADGAELDALHQGRLEGWMADGPRTVDTVLSWILVLEQTPDADHTRSARENMLAMIASNRIFWERVGAETDNGREWIPAPQQSSALPVAFPGEVGPQWLAILDDLEALLEGEVLAPHWRLGGMDGSHGINIRTFLENPQSMDLLGLIHGRGVLFAVEEGPIISTANWQAFQSLVGRQGGFFPFLLN